MKKKVPVYLAISLAVIFWGTSFVWSKSILEIYEPFTLVFSRLLLSVIFLLIISFATGYFKKIRKPDVLLFLLTALFQPFLYFIGETFGLKYVSSTLTSVIIATIPLFVPFAAYFFLNTKIRLITFAGIIISFSGVFVMVMQKGVLQSGSLTGFLFLFLAVLAAVGYSVVVKKLTDNYHPVTITLYQNIFGMLAFAPLFFIYDFSSVINIVPSSEIIITLLLLSFFSSTLAFVFFTYSVREIGVSRTSVFSNAIPVVTALLAFLYLGETLSLQKIAGIILVIAGVTISQVKTTKKIELQ